jgi:hypothetical protein
MKALAICAAAATTATQTGYAHAPALAADPATALATLATALGASTAAVVLLLTPWLLYRAPERARARWRLRRAARAALRANPRRPLP